MDNVNFELANARELQREFLRISKGIKAKIEMESVSMSAARIMVEQIKYNRTYKDHTGNLTDSIIAKKLKYGGTGVTVERKTAPHAHLIEYGTVTNPPYPFFRTGVASSAGQARAEIQSGLERIFGEVLR